MDARNTSHAPIKRIDRKIRPMEPGPEELRSTIAIVTGTLEPLLDRDWTVRAGDLEWNARTTLEHMANILNRYASHLASRARESLPKGRTTDTSWSNADLLRIVGARAYVLAAVISASPLEVRAFHTLGMADRSGFAAMACDELLIHTDDIAKGFDVPFEPPAELCRRILARLFPWAPTDADSWQTLRWANGRAAIGDRPRQDPGWVLHSAPLSDWDGSIPRPNLDPTNSSNN